MQIEEIYRLYFNDIYRYLLALTENAAVAEELTSDVFFKALRSIDSFRGECELRVWLCRIAKNCYCSYLKKKGRTVNLDEAEKAEAPSPAVEDTVTDRLSAQEAAKRLHDLPEVYKEVFMWRVYAELSFAEIGALFGKTANWACVTYHRARKMIQEEWEE